MPTIQTNAIATAASPETVVGSFECLPDVPGSSDRKTGEWFTWFSITVHMLTDRKYTLPLTYGFSNLF